MEDVAALTPEQTAALEKAGKPLLEDEMKFYAQLAKLAAGSGVRLV